MNKKKKTILIVALLLVVFIGSISYALWSVTLEQTGSNVVKTGCFTVNMQEESDAISLAEAYPITDDEGWEYDPFTFTIQNTCTIDSSYSVNLEVGLDTTLSESAVKTVLDENTPKVLTDYETVAHDDDIKSKYQLMTGTLAGASSEGADDGESITYDLRLWLDENTPESEMSKDFYAKIVIENITTSGVVARQVLATGDISATDADAVTYTLYSDGLLSIDGTGAIKDYDGGISVFSEAFTEAFSTSYDKKCADAGLDCSELENALLSQNMEMSDVYIIYSNYDTLMEYMIAVGEVTQAQLDEMGITTDVELIETFTGTDLDDDNANECIALLKSINVIEITDLKIGEGITSIGGRAFGWGNDLLYLDLSESELRLPTTLKSVGVRSFSDTNIKVINLNSGLENVAEYAFYNTTVSHLPGSVNLVNSSFSKATFVEKVSLDGYEELPISVFALATFENGVDLGNTLNFIRNNAFGGSNLSGELVIPNTVEQIGPKAFGNTQITSLSLPVNDVYVGDNSTIYSTGICEGCMNLKQVEIPLNVKYLLRYNSDLIWGTGTESAPTGAKYIMPIKASEYGVKYTMYLVTDRTTDIGAVSSLLDGKITVEWQPE